MRIASPWHTAHYTRILEVLEDPPGGSAECVGAGVGTTGASMGPWPTPADPRTHSRFLVRNFRIVSNLPTYPWV